jgi:hypothetical protein
MTRAIVTALLAVAFLASGAWAETLQHNHALYDRDCCRGEDKGGDCAPVKEGQVIQTNDGYFIRPTGETIPFGSSKIRKSKDRQTHRCTMFRLVPESDTRCIYIPEFQG